MSLSHVFLERCFSIEFPPTRLTVVFSVIQCMGPQKPFARAHSLADLTLDGVVRSDHNHILCLLFHNCLQTYQKDT